MREPGYEVAHQHPHSHENFTSHYSTEKLAVEHSGFKGLSFDGQKLKRSTSKLKGKKQKKITKNNQKTKSGT